MVTYTKKERKGRKSAIIEHYWCRTCYKNSKWGINLNIISLLFKMMKQNTVMNDRYLKSGHVSMKTTKKKTSQESTVSWTISYNFFVSNMIEL